jgi:hypothetical protein
MQENTINTSQYEQNVWNSDVYLQIGKTQSGIKENKFQNVKMPYLWTQLKQVNNPKCATIKTMLQN